MKPRPKHQVQEIIDASDLRKYRIEIPNLYDDADLTPFQFRLLVHYKRVGNCWEGTRKTAQKCHMSLGTVVAARKFLAQHHYIKLGKRSQYDTITVTVVDQWRENFKQYAKCSPHEHRCSPHEHRRSPHEQGVHHMNGSVHQVNERINQRRIEPNGKKEPPSPRKAVTEVNSKLAKYLSDTFEIDPMNAQTLTTKPHVTQSYIDAYIDFKRTNPGAGGGFYYDRMSKQIVPPNMSAMQAAQWKREQRGVIQ